MTDTPRGTKETMPKRLVTCASRDLIDAGIAQFMVDIWPPADPNETRYVRADIYDALRSAAQAVVDEYDTLREPLDPMLCQFIEELKTLLALDAGKEEKS